MKVVIKDVDTLASLKPLEIAGYLRSKRWSETTDNERLKSKWTFINEKEEEFEIILPLVKAISDYAFLMNNMLNVLEIVEKRSQIEIFKDIQTHSADIYRIPVPTNGSIEGSLSIEDGVGIIKEIKNMIEAAACATIDPKAVFPSRKSPDVVDYMEKLRLGQTEFGSYVFTVYSRVTPAISLDGQAQLENDLTEPFSRNVAYTLTTALQKIKIAAEDFALQGSSKSFEESIKYGVSANLCEAVCGIKSFYEDDASFELNVSWSPTRKVMKPVENKIVISSDSIPFIEEAAKILRESSPQESFKAIGQIVNLHREPNVEIGTVRMIAIIDEKPKKLTFNIGDPEYSKLVDAHRDKNLVICNGDLVKEKNLYYLKNPNTFEIFSNGTVD